MSEIKHNHVKAVIIGAGAGGGVIAKQLATSGIKCVLLERGNWPDYEDTPNDELINQRNHVLRPLHGPDRRKFPQAVDNGKGGFKASSPTQGDGRVIAACVGSGTVTYGAMAWRFMPQDFKLKTLYPNIKGSTLADWPITYDDLEPFYQQAEEEIGVAGDMKDNPFAPPRKKPYPMPAFEYNKEDENFIAPAMKRAGFHPFPIPMLRNSVKYNGRAACIRNHTCCGYVCPIDAKNGTQNSVIPAAIKTGNCEVRTGSYAFEVMMNGNVATGVKYFDENKNVHVQTADIVVIAASAIETARLMLMSKSKLFPNGIGNNNGWVGRNLHGHAYVGCMGLFDKDVVSEMGPGASVSMMDLNHNVKDGIFCGAICSEFYKLPVARAQGYTPKVPSWGIGHKKSMVENYRRIVALQGPIQEIPMFEARILLEDSVKDYFGLPVARITGCRHPLLAEQAKRMCDAVKKILAEAGAVQIFGGGTPNLNTVSAGQHQAGTCRMGNDPETSVVDANCKVWGTENIYLGDGSVNVTNGGFNPVLTIMALAYRTGSIIAKKHSKANIFLRKI